MTQKQGRFLHCHDEERIKGLAPAGTGVTCMNTGVMFWDAGICAASVA
jgi:hypothetical protein